MFSIHSINLRKQCIINGSPYEKSTTYEGSLSSLTWIEAWLFTPSMRWNALRFLCIVIWKTEAPPCLCKWKWLLIIRMMTRRDLPARDNAVCKEEWPDSEPSVTVLGNNAVLVADPIFIPAVDGSRVMDTENINIFDFETSTLQLEDRRWVEEVTGRNR